MEDLLKKFNLTNNETKIYLKLLELGSATAGQITAKTGVHRRNVYDSIERLIKKGLVGYIAQNNKKQFKATSPKHFFYLLELERETLTRKEKAFKEILPRLMLLQGLSPSKQRVAVFEGKEGMITILEDVLKTKKENLVYSTTKIRFINEYLKWFHKKRVKAKIVDKLILNQKETKRARYLAGLPYTEVKVIRSEFNTPLAINVYGNKVGMLIFSDYPISILIEDKQVADSFRKYFKLLWSISEKV